MVLVDNSNTAKTAAEMAWRIEANRSRVSFTIGKRLMFVKHLTVAGHFADIAGTIVVDAPLPTQARAAISIGVASIDTGNARRDAHLLTPDFFDVAQFPTITFTSRSVQVGDRSNGRYHMTGDLTIRGITRQVTLVAHYTRPLPKAVEPTAHILATTTVNRRDFGMTWNKPHINVEDELQITLDITLVDAGEQIG